MRKFLVVLFLVMSVLCFTSCGFVQKAKPSTPDIKPTPIEEQQADTDHKDEHSEDISAPQGTGTDGGTYELPAMSLQ